MTDEKKTPIEKFKEEVDAAKQHEVDAAIENLRRQLRRKDNDYNLLRDDFEQFKQSSSWLDLLARSYVEPKPITRSKKTGTAEGTIIGIASDWHSLEVVDPATVSGLNVYNSKIARESIERFFQGCLAWVDVLRSRIEINTFVLAFLGDLITNMFYDDAKETNEGSPQEEILFCLDRIISGIRLLKEEGMFDKIIIIGCDGNHGRDSKEGYSRASTRVKHSYEWLMYKFLELWYAGDDNVSFDIAQGYHLYKQIYDVMLRFHHGDKIRYYGGIGGVTIPANKAILEWNKGRKADLDVMGHWHKFMNPDLFLANGSVIGYSAYSIASKVGFERPQQSLLLIDSKRGITSVNRIYVR